MRAIDLVPGNWGHLARELGQWSIEGTWRNPPWLKQWFKNTPCMETTFVPQSSSLISQD